MLDQVWVDTETGEVVQSTHPGAMLIDLSMEEVETPREPDAEWLGDWLTKQETHLDAELSALKLQYELRVRGVKARQRHLRFAWWPRLAEVVRLVLLQAPGKKKSMDYAYARGGFRKSTKIEVTDSDAGLAWAEAHWPDAVKVVAEHTVPESRTLAKSKLPKGQLWCDSKSGALAVEGAEGAKLLVIPGVTMPEGDDFYIRPPKAS